MQKYIDDVKGQEKKKIDFMFNKLEEQLKQRKEAVMG